MMKRYNLINNILGWFSFAVAAVVYLMTIEPTASFWDCGEFITSAYKLEVGHPPGAPFFMLTGKFFSLFASDPSQVAMMVNAMSALLSAATILFLFWTITHLAKKLIYSDDSKEMTTGQFIAIMGSGLVGALTYTFTDTFWFSAVEGEVYAYSSMFTALVFWLILKWENRADQPGSDKWLILIAYAMGLSIGVHLLNLLCIPAIGLVYYFKKAKNIDLKGTLIALAVSVFLIVVLMYGIIPGFTRVGGWFEMLFVNSFGFSYNTGSLIYILLVVISIIWALYETMSQKGNVKRAKIATVISMTLSGVVLISDNALLWLVLIAGLTALLFLYKGINTRLLNTAVLCLMVILIGYSSFALIPIRSIANTPMDQNSPENVFTLASYLNREQYGDRPLFYGKTYASSEKRDANGRLEPPASEKKTYDKVVKKSPDQKDEYVVTGTVPTYGYDNTMFMPRMYSTESRHMLGYQIWAGIKDTSVPPTMFENLKFFFDYQLNFMYFRYFMWNFSGRQNDIQSVGNLADGNWITGIGFLDEWLGRGPQNNLPPDIAENKGHNKYYMLPLILGILGIAYQLTRGKKGEQQFLVTFMLFFMTGIAIIVYLNQQPFEPRERDYAYAGSFYAFCIWIGFGVAFLWRLLQKVLPETPAAAIVSVVSLLVPIQMASQNWDDHDRSDRYTMRDFGMNYLRGCEPNSILFTMGDNDTFPLWYAQEVEGFRTDVRVTNLSYLQTDWYVDQMRRQAYDSPPLPIEWEEDRYQGSKGQSAYVLSKKDIESVLQRELASGENRLARVNYSDYYDTQAYKDTMLLGDALEILRTKDNYAPRNPFGLDKGVVIPSSILKMPVDESKIDWAALGSQPKNEFIFNLGDNKGGIYRQEIMIMEMLYNINKDDWKRPIYYAVTIGEPPLKLMDQSAYEGIICRITPGVIDSTGVNVDAMFENMVNRYKWGGIENPNVYLDENNLRLCRSFRLMFSYLIRALLEKGDDERALIALDRSVEVLPGNTVPRGAESVEYAENYYRLGHPEKAQKIIEEILYRAEGNLQWYAGMKQSDMISCSTNIRDMLNIQIQILDIYQHYDIEKYKPFLDKILASTEVFLVNRVSFSDRNHPLDALMRITMRRYMLNEDTVARQEDGQLMERTAGLMQKYSPALLQKYYQQNN
ncbi:tetratricopeptide (TPR) repeat protein [Dysgonomonas hofstadii]|uniref:Tetratricopeptide (TPR) repeat protein n=2 Tax=Dysgonomonas hofstadii TaxID=637886 RepID=A0A840CN24_9BACT|nr:tetratricopeptide (TPR) repeat protein [Dysgonomonas hofstadii]